MTADEVELEICLWPAERAAEAGYEYGPVFQGLVAAWRVGEEFHAELRLPDGQRDEAGRFVMSRSIAFDVTERRRAERDGNRTADPLFGAPVEALDIDTRPRHSGRPDHRHPRVHHRPGRHLFGQRGRRLWQPAKPLAAPGHPRAGVARMRVERMASPSGPAGRPATSSSASIATPNP